MGHESSGSIWSPQSLLKGEAPDYCLMQPVPVLEGRRRLRDAGFSAGPNTGQGGKFEIWMTKLGYPQMVPYSDFPRNEMFDGEELQQALLAT